MPGLIPLRGKIETRLQDFLAAVHLPRPKIRLESAQQKRDNRPRTY